MIYRSNLSAPDLSPYFKLRDPAKLIAGHNAPSDPDFEPDCCFMTHDEAAILYHCAVDIRSASYWVDIGARFGWTAAHIVAAGAYVVAVDPQLQIPERYQRFSQNLDALREEYWGDVQRVEPITAAEYFATGRFRSRFDGAVIDGDHDEPQPLLDAQNCAARMRDTAVIVLHDAFGKPIRDAARWLAGKGWRIRMYFTPNGMIVAWRGDFTPPDHVRDPQIEWSGHELTVYREITPGEFS